MNLTGKGFAWLVSEQALNAANVPVGKCDFCAAQGQDNFVFGNEKFFH